MNTCMFVEDVAFFFSRDILCSRTNCPMDVFILEVGSTGIRVIAY